MSEYTRRIIVGGIVAAIVGASLIAGVILISSTSSQNLLWKSTTALPKASFRPTCISDTSYVYCIEPLNTTYFSKTSPSGLGSWQQTMQYPMSPFQGECVSAFGYMYCLDYSTNSAVYYTQLSSTGGVDGWKNTTSYPVSVADPSCVIDSSYIYCIGGQQSTNSVYYAELSSDGIARWITTTSYPIPIVGESCTVLSGHVYCVGGLSGNLNTQAVYYATINSSGVGSWQHSPNSYPLSITEPSCFSHGEDVYCVGGNDVNGYPTNETFYATVSSVGLSSWQPIGRYPTNIFGEACVSTESSPFVYCMGGTTGLTPVNGTTISTPAPVVTNSVYYAKVL